VVGKIVNKATIVADGTQKRSQVSFYDVVFHEQYSIFKYKKKLTISDLKSQ